MKLWIVLFAALIFAPLCSGTDYGYFYPMVSLMDSEKPTYNQYDGFHARIAAAWISVVRNGGTYEFNLQEYGIGFQNVRFDVGVNYTDGSYSRWTTSTYNFSGSSINRLWIPTDRNKQALSIRVLLLPDFYYIVAGQSYWRGSVSESMRHDFIWDLPNRSLPINAEFQAVDRPWIFYGESPDTIQIVQDDA
jgi:hypothetical protein